MIPSIYSSVSGVKAALKMIDVSANNTANADTDGFKKDTIRLKEGEYGGVVVNISKSAEDGPGYTNSDGKTITASNVNYAEEIGAQITAKQMMRANIAALKTADEMHKHLVDILA